MNESRGRAAQSAQQATTDRQASTIVDQQRTIRGLQVPVIQVWEGILALPIIGSLDAERTQEMTEALLQRIVETNSEIVLVDITGVSLIDSAVAKHLLETVAAARLMGAEVLVVGLTTRTAMTLVHLGVDLAGVTTRTTMAKGLELAFARLGLRVVREVREPRTVTQFSDLGIGPDAGLVSLPRGRAAGTADAS
jgi:rsbT co-antagonist protein RsbR